MSSALDTSFDTRPDASPTNADRPRVPATLWLLAALIASSMVMQGLAIAQSPGLGDPEIDPWSRLGGFSGLIGWAALIFTGFRHRHPLALRFYMVIPIVSLAGAALLIAEKLGSGSDMSWPAIAVSAGYPALLLACAWAHSTRRWFGLRCPACASMRVTGANLLMGRLRCRSCDHRWERSRVDTAAFD